MDVNLDIIDKFSNLLKDLYEQSKEIKNINIKNKELNDIVTDIDIFMENKLVEAIKYWYPTHSIYAEESGEVNLNSNYQWVVDPIDGTVNFAASLPIFSTSISLLHNGIPVLGIVYDYSNNEIYYAIKGKGAFCNNKPIKVSNRNELKNCIISFILTSDYNEKYIKQVLTIEEKITSKVRGLRLICSSAIELCWLASGRLDGFLKIKPSRGIGSTAGKLIVQEAGGKVTNLFGKNQSKVDGMIVTNGLIHEEIISILKNI